MSNLSFILVILKMILCKAAKIEDLGTTHHSFGAEKPNFSTQKRKVFNHNNRLMTEQKRFEGKKEKKLLIFHMVSRQFSKRKMISEEAKAPFSYDNFFIIAMKMKYHSTQLAISIHFSIQTYKKYCFRLCKC